MSLGLAFVVIVVGLIAWFLLDGPVQPAETLPATVVSVKPLPQVSGPPTADVTLQLADRTTILLKLENAQAWDSGRTVTVRRLKRRLSGVASYEVVK